MLTIFTISFFTDVWHGSNDASGLLPFTKKIVKAVKLKTSFGTLQIVNSLISVSCEIKSLMASVYKIAKQKLKHYIGLSSLFLQNSHSKYRWLDQ